MGILNRIARPKIVPGHFGPHGPMLASLDDGKRFTLPEYVRQMSRGERKEWMRVNRVVPAIDGGAYSMFEMMQPFMIADAPAVTAAANTALTQDLLFTLPANIFAFPGKTLWMHASGVLTTTATPGTYTFSLNWGGVAGTVIATTGALAPWAVVNTNTLWYADFWIKARATGGLTTSLTVSCHGQVQSPTWTNTVTQLTTRTALEYAPSNSATPGTAFADIASLDQTVAKALTLAVTPSVATGSIACRDAFVVAMN